MLNDDPMHITGDTLKLQSAMNHEAIYTLMLIPLGTRYTKYKWNLQWTSAIDDGLSKRKFLFVE